MSEVKTSQIIKDSKKKVEKVIDSILKELEMKRKEFDEVKGIAMEMKASGQSELLTPTPIIVPGPTKEVIVAQTSVQAPTMPYAIVVQQQPPRNLVKIEEMHIPWKSTRVKRTKTPSKKRAKQTPSGPRKKRRNL